MRAKANEQAVHNAAANSEAQMKERNVESWEEFKKELTDLRRELKTKLEWGTSALLFRGQENSCWLLKTTLDRKREQMRFADYYRLIGKIRPEIESLTGAEWPIPEYPEIEKRVKGYDNFSQDLTFGRWPGYAYMAYLRHHGFPSPLLDWTRSPYVAAFYAFNKAAGDSKARVSIYVLSKRHFTVGGNRMMNVFYPGPYVTTHRRHVLQQSQYTLCLTYENEWRFGAYDAVFNEGPGQQGSCLKFTIPASEKRKALKELDEYNLNGFSLFGSEESMMETLATREFVFTDEI